MTLANVPAHRGGRCELEGTVLALVHFSLFPFNYLLVIFVLLNLLILKAPTAANLYLIAAT